jgi:glycosyltransferase involved in cell wall biosynthesis
MTRLLIVSQPLSGGTCRHILDLLAFIDTERCQVDVVCPPESELWTALERTPGVRLHAFTAQRYLAPSDLRSFVRLLRLVRDADVVHAHSSKAGLLVRLATAVTGHAASCVFTPHGWSFWALRGWPAGLCAGFERAAARWCHAIIAVSAFERDAGLRRRIGRPGQYRLVPNGIDVERFAVARRPVEGRIVMVGRLAKQKRPDLAIRALALLRPRLPQAHLQLVGDGPLRRQVEHLVRELELSGAVQLLGPRNDVPELLRSAQCLVLTSEYEASPLSVLEAMSAGVPVVSARFGGVAELIDGGRTGIVVEPDPSSIAEGLHRLLSDTCSAWAIGTAGHAEAHVRFNRERMAAGTLAVYREVLAAGRSRPTSPSAECSPPAWRRICPRS